MSETKRGAKKGKLLCATRKEATKWNKMGRGNVPLWHLGLLVGIQIVQSNCPRRQVYGLQMITVIKMKYFDGAMVCQLSF